MRNGRQTRRSCLLFHGDKESERKKIYEKQKLIMKSFSSSTISNFYLIISPPPTQRPGAESFLNHQTRTENFRTFWCNISPSSGHDASAEAFSIAPSPLRASEHWSSRNAAALKRRAAAALEENTASVLINVIKNRTAITTQRERMRPHLSPSLSAKVSRSFRLMFRPAQCCRWAAKYFLVNRGKY